MNIFISSAPVVRTYSASRIWPCRSRGKGVLGGSTAFSLKHPGHDVGQPPADIAVTNSTLAAYLAVQYISLFRTIKSCWREGSPSNTFKAARHRQRQAAHGKSPFRASGSGPWRGTWVLRVPLAVSAVCGAPIPNLHNSNISKLEPATFSILLLHTIRLLSAQKPEEAAFLISAAGHRLGCAIFYSAHPSLPAVQTAASSCRCAVSRPRRTDRALHVETGFR